MAAKDPSIYEYIMIQSADGQRTVNIEPAVVGIQYFEDIFSPTITGTPLNFFANNKGSSPHKKGSLQTKPEQSLTIKEPACFFL